MAILSPGQIAGYASQAGFSGNSLIIAISIALAESGGNTQAYNPETGAGTPIGSGSRGLWQIYGKAHPQYNNDSLYDPLTNAKAAYVISSGGSNWNPWSTYTNGSYTKYMNIAKNAVIGSPVGGSIGPPQRWNPAYLRDMTAWIANPSIWMYGRWNQPASAMEGGVDLGSPGGTPVYALADGPIIGAGNFWHPNGNPGYGVVTQRINVPGYGVNDLYYQHIAIDPAIKNCNITDGQLYGGVSAGPSGQSLIKGQQVGTIRSNVGMLEMGFNADWGGAWGVNHPNAWVTDPRPLIKSLMDAGPPGTPTFNFSLLSGSNLGLVGTYIPISEQIHETLINTPGFYGIALALDEAEQFPGYIDISQPTVITTPLGPITIPDFVGTARSFGVTITDNFIPFAIRSGIVVLGMSLMLALVIKVAGPVIEEVIPLITQAAAAA